jgi:drug/metabolite transporter (DMT)-like permease
VVPIGILLLANGTFLITGIVQNLLAFQLDVLGLGEKSQNNLLAAAQPLGAVILCAAVTSNIQTVRRIGVVPLFKRYWIFAALDIGGGIFTQISIALIGSGIFTVIYSTIVVYIALLSTVRYGRKISRVRWGCLILITCSAIFSALGQLDGASDASWTLVGIASALGATLSYGTLYVQLSETYCAGAELSQTCFCLVVSGIETAWCALYFLLLTLPRWHEWVVAPMEDAEAKGGADSQSAAGNSSALMLFVAIVLFDGAHQIGFYYVTSFGKIAAIGSGVNKALQAAILFIVSHWLFCSRTETSQCMNLLKSLGTFGVCLGVVAYAFDREVEGLLIDTAWLKAGDGFSGDSRSSRGFQRLNAKRRNSLLRSDSLSFDADVDDPMDQSRESEHLVETGESRTNDDDGAAADGNPFEFGLKTRAGAAVWGSSGFGQGGRHPDPGNPFDF